MTGTFRCAYCGRDKPVQDRSLEHVWPERLGGQLGPNFFKTNDVDHRCNNLSGLFVDGEFIRSFFTGVEEFQSSLHYVDTSKAAALPLVYMGSFTNVPADQDEVCECWLGPRGERIFYFHKTDRADFSGFAAGDPIRRRRTDAGRVYLTFTRANMYWIAVAVLSAKQMFPGAPLRLLTRTNDPGLLAECASEDEQSVSDRLYIEPLLARKRSHTRLSVALDHGQRFQRKLALGFGHTLFGTAFGETTYAAELRQGLWERDPEKRKQFRVLGTPLLADLRDHDEAILGLRGAYTFVFMRVQGKAMSLIYGPSTRSLRTVIAEDIGQLPSTVLDEHGALVVVLAPWQQRCLGPFPMMRYITHRQDGPKIAELAEFEASYQSLDAIETAVAKWDVPQ